MGINIVQKILSKAATEFSHFAISIRSKKNFFINFGMENFEYNFLK